MDLVLDFCPGCYDPGCIYRQCVPLTQVIPPPPPLFLGLQKGPGGQSLLVGKTATELEADKKAEQTRQLRRLAIGLKKGLAWAEWCSKQAGLCKCPECQAVTTQGNALLARALPKDRRGLMIDILSCKKMDLDKAYPFYFWDYDQLARYGITV